MTFVKRRSHEWFKETITISERKERIRLHNKYVWNFLDYLYTPKKVLEFDTWGNLVGKFKTLHENVEKLIIKKLHGGTKVWCIQQKN
jgi:hypothetical protein